MLGFGSEHYAWMPDVIKEYPFIQYLHLLDAQGILQGFAVIPEYQQNYDKMPLGYDFSGRQWFIETMKTGALHVTDVYQSHFTDKLIITVSTVITDDNDDISGVVAWDIQLEELLQRAELLDQEKEEE